MRRLDEVPDAIRATVRNQGGGHADHQLLWKIMHPGRSQPGGELLAQIEQDYGSLDAMKAAFKAAGMARFGSGWVFLLFDPHAGQFEVAPDRQEARGQLRAMAERGRPSRLHRRPGRGTPKCGHTCRGTGWRSACRRLPGRADNRSSERNGVMDCAARGAPFHLHPVSH